MTERRIVILTEGRTTPTGAKTASCVVRYKPKEVVALLDTTQSGKTAGQLLGVGGSIPIIGKLADAAGANTLLIGIAPSGGKLPPAWRAVLLEAIDRGMNLVSGLHDFLSNDAEIAAAAAKKGVEIGYSIRPVVDSTNYGLPKQHQKTIRHGATERRRPTENYIFAASGEQVAIAEVWQHSAGSAVPSFP